MGVDSFQADRSAHAHVPHRAVRRALESPEGGFYHDGRFASLRDVVDHYDRLRKVSLTEQEKRDLIEYLQSL